MMHKIKGKVVFLDLGPGSWGILGEDGRQWLPVEMPNQLKVRDAEVMITAKESDLDSMIMWGVPVEIVSYHTLPRV
ncbi:MAG: hypothetical protein HKN76_04085 [Saprospiraceae bacterium]|nr:hypothetical protein [Saprospiraceae bacterium]